MRLKQPVMKSEVFSFIDVIGTAAFSVSGVFAAMEKKVDIFGILVVAFITAIGGGTIRDVIIDDLPVAWVRTSNYSIVIFISAFTAMLFNNFINNYRKILVLFDSIGLGFFTLVGIQKGVAFGFSPGLCIALGTITACFGGVVRDIVLNKIPHIFDKEIYATACIFGGLLYFILRNASVHADIVDAMCISLIVLIRIFAVRYNWRLPDIHKERKKR